MTDYRFDGRVVVVTGAGQGLGEAYAQELAKLGAALVLADLGEGADRVAAALGGGAIAVGGDIADPATSAAIVAAALDSHGRIDAIINNAGIGLNRPFAETSVEDFRRILEINYFGTLHLIRAAWPNMVSAGYGRIVNIVSTSMYGFPGWSGYAATKGAVLGLSRTLALEAAPLGILINMLAPSAATPMMSDNGIDAATQAYMQATMPVAAVAPTAAFLAHEACASVGQVYVASAGRTAPMALAEAEGVTLAAPDVAGVAAAVADPAFTRDWRPIASVAEARH